MGKELAPETISSTTTCFNVRCPEKTLSTMYSIFPMEWTHTDPETALAGRALFSCFTEFTSADIFPMLNGFITGDEYLYPYISSRRICHVPRRVGGYRSCFWLSCLNSAMPSSRAPQGCPQVYGSACARIYCLPALSLRSGLPKPFSGRRLSLRLKPSSRRLPCRWASQPTRAVNSCTVYSVVKFHESLKKFCFSLYRQRERQNGAIDIKNFSKNF